MDMQGSRLLPVTQAQAWEALNNPDILKACIPGCDKFEAAEPNVYAVGVSLKIGPVAAKFAGKVSLRDIQAPTSYAMQFEAQGGVAGFGKGTAQVLLTTVTNGCELSYTVNAQVGGKLAQLGQRLIDGVAKNLSEDFFRRFEEALLKHHADSTQVAQDADTVEPVADRADAAWLWWAGAVVAVLGFWWLNR